ncbi:MAG: hypothetical protein JWM95_1720 [Gemmatimonadetes bacterium]|nr:hypothetical protein [Gemmatimonadota bacterium]
MTIRAIRTERGALQTVRFERDGESTMAAKVTLADELQQALRYTQDGAALILTPASRDVLMAAMTLYCSALADEVDAAPAVSGAPQ